MTLRLYSIRDIKADVYSPPFAAQNDALAYRMFGEVLEDGRTLPAKHPEDYTLWRLADMDQQTGAVKPETPIQIARALDFMPQGLQELESDAG